MSEGRGAAAVICDMDGVLFDSEPVHIRAWQQVLAARGHEVPAAWFVRCIGIPDRETADYVHAHLAPEATAAALLAAKRATYRAMAARELTPFAGVVEGLRALRADGVPLALATASPAVETELLLGCTGLLDFFSLRVTAEDVARPKPAPDPYLRAAALLGVAPARARVVEDSPPGVAAAHAAGCTVLAVTTSHPAEALAAAHHTFPTTAAALAWLRAGR